MRERIEIHIRDGRVAQVWLWEEGRGGTGAGRPIYTAPPRKEKESKADREAKV